MAFPFGLVAGVGSAIFGAASQASAQRREVERQEAIARDRLAFDQKVYDWNNLVSQTQYQYDLLRTEALRTADAQYGADYIAQQERVIEQAVENYMINRQAIADQFIKSEALRAKKDQLEFQQANLVADRNLVEQMRQQANAQKANQLNMQVAGDSLSIQQEQLGLRATEVARQSSYEAAINGLQLAETVRGFLQTGKEIRNAADVRARGAERAISEVMGSIAIEEGTDNFGWQLSQVQAMLEDGVLEARGAAQGSGKTAQRLAISSAQALGRTWGQQVLRSRSRGLRVNLANELLNKELATQSAGDVLRLEDLQARAGFQITTSSLRNENILGGARNALDQTEVASRQQMNVFRDAMDRGELSFDDSMGAQQFALKAYTQDWEQRQKVLKQLTIPSYNLARRQGIREAQGLYLRTKGTIENAAMPYRGQMIFDPIAPIPGPGPEQSGTANFSSPGFGQVLAGNLAAAGGKALAEALPGFLQGNLFPNSGGSNWDFNASPSFTSGIDFSNTAFGSVTSSAPNFSPTTSLAFTQGVDFGSTVFSG